MEAYKCKAKKISGSDYHESSKIALAIYRDVRKKSKRKPYLRSPYFNNEKVFLDYFWVHLQEKNWQDRARRLKFYSCALDLIENNRIEPESSRINPNNKAEKIYRFIGICSTKEKFCVQIKENLKKKQKYFLSVYPLK